MKTLWSSMFWGDFFHTHSTGSASLFYGMACFNLLSRDNGTSRDKYVEKIDYLIYQKKLSKCLSRDSGMLKHVSGLGVL